MFNRFSIRKNFILLVLIFFIPMTMLSGFSSLISLRAADTEISRSYALSLNVFANKLESNLQKYAVIVKSLATDRDILALGQAPVNPSNLIIWDYVSLLRQLRLFSATTELNVDLSVYFTNINRVFSSSSGLGTLKDDLSFWENGKWILRDLDAPNSHFSLNYTSNAHLTKKAVVATVDIPTKDLKNLLRELSTNNPGIGFLITADQNVLFHESSSNIDMDAIASRVPLTQSESGIFDYSQSGTAYRVFYTSTQSGIIYGFIHPEQGLLAPVNRLILLTLLFLVVATVLTLLFSSFAQKRLINPIYELISAFSKLKNGDFNVQIPINGTDEFSNLFLQFNTMASKLSSTMEENLLAQKNLEKSKLNLLQSQIDPHFLYNSLNFIYRMISSEQLEAASTMTLYLGKYFTYATKLNTDTSSIEDEIQNIQTYVNIQRMRYSSKIVFNVDLQETLRRLLIPRLLLQPIVENIFSHGNFAAEETIRISMSLRKKDRFVEISICDNGKGMNEQQLHTVVTSLGELNRKDGFALSNIYWRLKLLYADTAKMEIESVENMGTCIRLLLPVATNSKELLSDV